MLVYVCVVGAEGRGGGGRGERRKENRKMGGGEGKGEYGERAIIPEQGRLSSEGGGGGRWAKWPPIYLLRCNSHVAFPCCGAIITPSTFIGMASTSKCKFGSSIYFLPLNLQSQKA